MRRAALAAALLCAGPALAQDVAQFDGDWTLGDPAACEIGRDSVNLAMRIRGGVLEGYESRCELTEPEAVRGTGAVSFVMACSGEGDQWTSDAIFMRDGDGQLTTIWDGFVMMRQACTGYAPGHAPDTRPAAPPTK